MHNLSKYSPLSQAPPVYKGNLLQPEAINKSLLNQFESVKNEPDIKKTHHFMGRFENTYIPTDRIPAVSAILDMGRCYAAEILKLKPEELRLGYWFNEMQPGHETSLHTHEEEDELLSAVYYITAPQNSGDLVILNGGETINIPPLAGCMVLFKPEVAHRVETNNSGILRLSVAINFGLLNPEN